LTLVAAEIELWVVPLDRSDREVERLRPLLAGDERERAGPLPLSVRKRRYAVRQGAVREILSRYAGAAPRELQIRRAKHGKPMLEKGPAFSVSDSHELALLAVGTDELGVDVERVVERRSTRGLTPCGFRAFYEKWTAHEATAKADGSGLFPPSESIDRWRLWRIAPAPGYLATVAANPSVERIAIQLYAGDG
jgi:4'-phosphopantetheinyl transferase